MRQNTLMNLQIGLGKQCRPRSDCSLNYSKVSCIQKFRNFTVNWFLHLQKHEANSMVLPLFELLDHLSLCSVSLEKGPGVHFVQACLVYVDPETNSINSRPHKV